MTSVDRIFITAHDHIVVIAMGVGTYSLYAVASRTQLMVHAAVLHCKWFRYNAILGREGRAPM